VVDRLIDYKSASIPGLPGKPAGGRRNPSARTPCVRHCSCRSDWYQMP
jgi:hypothetical protein